MINPFHKIGKKINKALGGAGGGRRSSTESNIGLQQEDDATKGDAKLAAGDATPIQAQHSGQGEKGIIQNFSSGMENFIKAITDPPRTHSQPIRTSVPEDEEDEYQNNNGTSPDAPKAPREVEPPPVQLDETTPVDVLLARIEYLETNLRNEINRAETLDEQVLQLEGRILELERIASRSILTRVLRPFRMCFGVREEQQQGISRQSSRHTYGY